MFNSLDEQIKRTHELAPAPWRRMLQHASVLGGTGALFWALCFGMLFLE